MTLISIVVPIYNVENYLEECLDSIINQTHKSLEIILVNDGSTDNSPTICDNYASKDSRIKVIHKKNGGLGSAYNTGIEAATGEYVGLVEPDDWIEPDMYELLLETAQKYDTDAVKCGFWEYCSTNKIKDIPNCKVPFVVINEPRKSFVIEEYPIMAAYHSSVWSYLYKGEFIKQLKFVEAKGAGYVDAPFGFEMLCKAKKLAIVPYNLYHWRLDNQGNSTSLCDRRVIAMVDRFLEAKKTLKELGKYDALKEVYYLHAVMANKGFYEKIQFKYKHEYFNRLQEIFREIENDPDFEYKYTKPFKKWINQIIKNRYLSTFNICLRFIRRFIISFHFGNDAAYFQLLGIQFVLNQDINRFALIKIRHNSNRTKRARTNAK